MKRSVEISHDELIELLNKVLKLDVPSQCISISARCTDVHDTGYGMLQVKSITLQWDEGSSLDSRWDR